MRISEEVCLKLCNAILDRIKFKKTESGYYLTTDEIRSQKLREKLKVDYVRLYCHRLTRFSTLYIKFLDGTYQKYFPGKLISERILSHGKKPVNKRGKVHTRKRRRL
jgi:hypothetical protein